jgi:hypothetical protein
MTRHTQGDAWTRFLLLQSGGGGRTRTYEGIASGFTVRIVRISYLFVRTRYSSPHRKSCKQLAVVRDWPLADIPYEWLTWVHSHTIGAVSGSDNHDCCGKCLTARAGRGGGVYLWKNIEAQTGTRSGLPRPNKVYLRCYC